MLMFTPWKDNLLLNAAFNEKLNYHEIVVPTVESIRCSQFIKRMIEAEHHVMQIGPANTGKTVFARSFLSQFLGEDF